MLSQKARFESEGIPPFTAFGRINEVADAYNKAVLDWVKTKN
jgi:hypothetical protein